MGGVTWWEIKSKEVRELLNGRREYKEYAELTFHTSFKPYVLEKQDWLLGIANSYWYDRLRVYFSWRIEDGFETFEITNDWITEIR